MTILHFKGLVPVYQGFLIITGQDKGFFASGFNRGEVIAELLKQANFK